ncbi:hypothetical protein [Nocardioides gilvus]|uniref:hypothetical protein n=1 Tax=Nocardioides gilvus TaxID=1735589 RepID=UPI000D7422E6|nr:hypothetical protein [Nocardioides gilvus]
MSPEEGRNRVKPPRGSPPTHQHQVVGQCLDPLENYPECDLNPCTGTDGSYWHSLQESPVAADPPVWTHVGYVCLGSPDELTRQEISAASVAREFRRLTWPAADLVIQPPDGETLVNLETIFHTPDTAPVTQNITLLGQQVDIEATPTTWTWHWAQPDDRASEASHQAHTSTDPGGAYPSRAITHTYTLADTTVHPSLDVTYTGRYRVNGGPWQTIPGDHTVPGTPQPLTILQARPGLVR